MADFNFWALGESSVSLSGGGILDGVTQGDGSHLQGLMLTIDSFNYEQIFYTDNDSRADDNDRSQRLDGAQTFDGVSYGNNTRIEFEYQFTLYDAATDTEYTALALNFRTTSPSYGTIEGLVFVGEAPPVGVPLEITSTAEGPGSSGQAPVQVADIAPPCFTPGTLIATPEGERPVENLKVGDLVSTLDRGAQPVFWVGHSRISAWALAQRPELRPIIIEAHAFGPNQPCRQMRVSPQHRILIEGWRAEILFGERQVLVAAKHLINHKTVRQSDALDGTTYIHVQCCYHEVLISDGLRTESFNPGPGVARGLPDAAFEELQALFPDHDLLQQAPLTAARPMLRRREAALLVA